ncbi:hypothetical protein DV453_003581 [Geotrichum candidum]|nr:hypothetical protein DV453_003581 [Geotrichum candidum]
MSIRGTSRFHSMPISLGKNNDYSLPLGNSDGPGDYGRNPKYSPSNYFDSTASDEGFLNKLQHYSEKVDTFLGTVGAPIQPYLPVLGRSLIVATFFEDGFRIFSQWEDQVSYIWSFRGFPRFITVLFLALNIVLMYVGSISVITHKKLIAGVGSLLFVVISQALMYGLFFNFSFFVRNLSVIGGLLMVVSDAFVHDRRLLSLPGLPLMEDKDSSKYFQLAGRVLMILLFLAYAMNERFTFGTSFGITIGLISCILVVIGYKARLSAAVLVIILLYRNLTSNQYWNFDSSNPIYDFLKYEHFQILSIIGGLLLVVNSGAGALSIDEKKKIY